MSLPGPGLHKGIPFEEYASWDAANAHGLGILARRTPAHLRYELDHGGADRTDAMELGALLHVAALEPERWAREFVVAPVCDRRYKEGKALWAQFEAAHPDATVVEPKRHALVCDMSAAILAHETARELLTGPGISEVCLVWKESDLPCKARLDRIAQVGTQGVIVDVKTCEDARRRSIERAIATYGYHIQGAHYVSGCSAVAPLPEGNTRRSFMLVCVETKPPHCVAVYDVDDIALSEGDNQRKRALRIWRQCRESGSWPGYPAGADVASIPPWELKSFDDAPEL